MSTNGGNTGGPRSSVGRLLEEMRRRKGLSLQEAARWTGVPAQQLADLENGDHAPLPDADYLRLLLRVYADYSGLDGSGARPPRMVEARGVCKSYRTEELTVHALEDVNLSIGRGELVAVMGPSGCGKTTLLNALSGLDAIDRGEIFIAGEPLHTMSDARRTEYRASSMGFVFQGFNLMPVLSAVENVELPLLVSGAGVGAA
ncbi:MAG: ATP-binding cassette domain-containing protein, partial [Actinomycetota bacterium]|nr:ATP-binding cassette domain-containing protein [Actinomycetota bacterium]